MRNLILQASIAVIGVEVPRSFLHITDCAVLRMKCDIDLLPLFPENYVYISRFSYIILFHEKSFNFISFRFQL